MITGIDWSSWSTVTDAKAMMTQREVVDIAYVRAWDGYKDDQEFDNSVTGISYRKLLESASTAHGSVLWGPFMFLGYSASVGSLTWAAKAGNQQAADMWNRATNGGRTFQLPVAVDVERNSFIDSNGVRQIVPFPSADAYCTAFLVPAIDYLTSAMGRPPVIYSNPDVILNFLAPVLSKYPKITGCPLWIASYSSGTAPAYWDRIKAYWPKWLMWQNAGDIRDWPGISDVDHNYCQGTRAQWKAWMADATAALPQDGTVDPIPTPPPPTTDPSVTELAVRVTAIEAKLASGLTGTVTVK